MDIKIVGRRASPTSKAGLGFYPTIKYVGQLFDGDGKFIGETGKCASRMAAYHAAEKLAAKLESSR